LAIDDSAFFRRILSSVLGHDEGIELIGCASDPYEARDLLRTTKVDVLTLDLEMPRMDGLTFLKLLMDNRPMPVIVMSSLTQSGSKNAVEALLSGAFDVIEKPADLLQKLTFGQKLVANIKRAAVARRRLRVNKTQGLARITRSLRAPAFHPRQVIALGASTGGTHALREILMALPANLPGIAIVQHIPPKFSASFAQRLNGVCAMEVREARSGDILHGGLALVAPGGYHMEVFWARDRYLVELHLGPPVEHQRPSVDVLFNSVAQAAGANAVAALLTGMGKDGAAGMKRLHDRQAHTIAQDEESCVVFGMPRKAIELNAVDTIASLEAIPTEIMKALESNRGHMAATHHE
jgi:two-component system chemotaxis response regulator CheB